MKTFVIFDSKTGEILQTHVQTDEGHGRAEDLLKRARAEAQPETVDFMAVETLAPGTSYRVDVKAKKLISVERNKVKGAGGGVVQSVAGDPRTARTVFFQMAQKKNKE
jgi:hypothetical protein